MTAASWSHCPNYRATTYSKDKLIAYLIPTGVKVKTPLEEVETPF